MEINTKKILERELLLFLTVLSAATGLVTWISLPVGIFSYVTAVVLFALAMIFFGWYCFVGRIFRTTEKGNAEE